MQPVAVADHHGLLDGVQDLPNHRRLCTARAQAMAGREAILVVDNREG
jgi:hypothetical protein